MNKIEISKEIINRAIAEYKPRAIVMMLSGGDDSITAYAVCRELGVGIDAVIHGYTGTGIQETTNFSIEHVERYGDKLIIADAGTAYEDYVMRKGFFGVGETAHNYAYHVLKIEHFRKAISKYFRMRRRNYPILFINGARRSESSRRMRTMKTPIRTDPSQNNNIWVNIINDWSKDDCLAYLNGNSIDRSPVSKVLCRSGECMCGTMQTRENRIEAAYHFPDWGKWLDDLESRVIKKFPWKWGETINKKHLAKMHGQLEIDFQPMCTDCVTLKKDAK